MKKRLSGVTLIELMVGIALLSILASLAVPSFRAMMARRAASSAAELLVGDLRFARTEALKRLQTVTVCQSSDGTSCSNAQGGWRSGWIVFIDAGAVGTVNVGDQILRVQAQPQSIATIQNNPVNDRIAITYQATGLARSADQSFFVTPSGTVPTNAVRLVCTSIVGRPSLRAVGATSCT